MIEIELNSKVYKMASNWDEVTFGQVMELKHIENDEMLVKLGSSLKDAKVLTRFCFNPEQRDELFKFIEDNFTMEDFKGLSAYFKWANIEEMQKKKDALKTDLKVINIDENAYNFKDNWNQTTMTEQNAFEMQLQHNKNLAAEEIAFAVYFRKIEDGEYEDFDMDIFERNLKLVEDVKYLDVIHRIELFFSGESTSSQKLSKGYSLKIITPQKECPKKKSKESEKTKKQKQALVSQDGDGSESGKQ